MGVENRREELEGRTQTRKSENLTFGGCDVRGLERRETRDILGK